MVAQQQRVEDSPGGGQAKPPTWNRRAGDAIEDLLALHIPALQGRVLVKYDLRRRSYTFTAHHRGETVFVHFHTSLADPRCRAVIRRAAEAAASMLLQSSHATAVYGEAMDAEGLQYD